MPISDHHKTVLILFNSGFASVKHCIVCKMCSYIVEQSRSRLLAYQKSRQEWILLETTTHHPILSWFLLPAVFAIYDTFNTVTLYSSRSSPSAVRFGGDIYRRLKLIGDIENISRLKAKSQTIWEVGHCWILIQK